jgi:hypothetical protein
VTGTVGYEGNALVHHCHCGKWGSFGFDVSLREGRLGTWYCGVHRPDKSDGAQAPVIVRLSDAWLARAIEVGKGRQAYAVANDLVHYGNNGDYNPESYHIIGAIGECGTAKHYRLKWTPRIEYVRGEVDVGGIIDVRSSPVPGTGYNLGIKPGDRDDLPYVLALVHLDDYRVELRGWLWGREGKGNPDIWFADGKCWYNRPPYRPLHELEALVPKLLAALK